MPDKPLTIGQLAQRAAVNIETIRYYQRVGLLLTPARPARGYRLYGEPVVARIRFIKRAQQLGFTLNEITELLAFGETGCVAVRERAELKRRQIDAQLRHLQALRNSLDSLIEACKQRRDGPCPLVESLSKPGAKQAKT